MPSPPSGLVQIEPASGRPTGAAEAPRVPLQALDQLWFQVSGTVCNLRCRHCFISCGPDNHSFWFMERSRVRTALEASLPLGVKEYYFTGGEPFMHPEMVGILEDALERGPASVLTNATILPPRTVDGLARAAAGSPYTLEIRVSLDGFDAAMNDAIRGEGSFRRALGGVERLVGSGFLPIITCMRSWEESETPDVLAAFRELLAGIGYDRARLKVMPALRMGEEARRTGGYGPAERVSHEMLHGFDLDQLLCSRARLVTARGVWTCPILLDEPSARLGDTLEEAVERPARLGEPACFTCWMSGAICSNTGSGQDFQ